MARLARKPLPLTFLASLAVVALTVLVGRGAQAPARPAESTAAPDAIRANNLGVASMNQQRFEQALEHFEQAAKLDPSFPVARVNQAIALLNLQRHEEARALLEQAAEQDPDDPRAWYNLGLLQRSLGEGETALASFEKAAAARPRDPHTRYFVGLMAAQLQQYEKAVEAFTRALEIDPFLVSAEFGLARAYQRLGQADNARTHLQRFQRLTTEKVASAMSLAYGDQGPFSLAQAVALPLGDTPAIPVTFAMQPLEESGALGERALPDAGQRAQPEGAGTNPNAGPGACLLDFDGDGQLDLLRLGSGGAVLFRNAGGGRLEEHATLVKDLAAGACAVGDFDNDERPDVAISFLGGIMLFRNGEDGQFSLEASKLQGAGAEVVGTQLPGDANGAELGLAFVDYDHDGDLDLIVARSSVVPFAHIGGERTAYSIDATASGALGPTPLADDVPQATSRSRQSATGSSGAAAGERALPSVESGRAASPKPPLGAANSVYRNNGDGTFAEVAKERGLAGDGHSVAVAASDLNNDRAIDLVITGDPTTIRLNPREGEFPAAQPWSEPMPSPTLGVAVLDFNKDGWMDLAFTHDGEPGVSLWSNQEGQSFARVALPEAGLTRAFGLAALDYDNDGWIDLAVAGETAAGGRVAVFRNQSGTYADASKATGAAELKIDAPRALLAGDIDGDGDADLIVTSASAGVSLLRNEGGNKHSSIRLTLQGLNDNRTGIGTKVEVQAGPVWQKFETAASGGFLGQSAPVVLAGLGTQKEVDVIRLLWPTGVVQDEVQLAAGVHAIEQIDRRGSSCPIVFTWNGREYEFITDAIGPAVVGHWVAPGQRNVPDPDEYIRIEGRQLQPRNGRLSVKFMEPMEEVIYLDEVRLVAIDHPEGTDIFPNEYFAAIAPPPSPVVFGVRDARLPLGAWDDAGRDVMAEIRERDGTHVSGFADAPFKGFAALHGLELDLGPLPAGAPVRLIMSGFTDYFTATSVFAAHQADVTPVVPYLEAQTRSGEWVRVSDDIGFPAGLRRTMTADLTGKLPEGTRRVRIWTNLKVYWDQILVDTTPAGAVPMRRSDAPLAGASLGFFGFPRERTGTPAADLSYSYREVSRFGPWARHRGFYTRYGDVAPLVSETDDRFAIFGAGDETSLEFDAAALPPLPEGWTRDYLLYVRGYVKDMDFYAAHGQTVTPLPFSGMGGYPYPDELSYPESLSEYLLEWNTRLVMSEGWPSYRLSYRSR